MNLDFIAKPMGMLVELLYNMVSGLDSSYLSAYAIAIILSTIIFKLLMMPFTLKQSKSMKKMQELNPKIKELQEKYGKDPQTLQRKQMELYKEANYSPFSGCLPMLIQFPILISFFYVIRSPEIYVFDNQQAYDVINKTFLWIRDLSFAENYVYESGIINGISMGMAIPFIGAALPILAAVSAFTTYLTTKMTSQPAMNEQQEATQRSMNMMMPVMIFIFGLQFPAGLALYWVVSNIFQLVQQYIVMNSSKNPKEELK
ncbi:membrane protein insertase YidC [Sedimentibacter hydroxybenzoicus DSM 7310]|uniref:Membrane protein insertase YidC n=1 Tax=Sedimentibacter hydroxybenzoicus DSM 7310 TaxID=1123245 RepID=A0A974BMJ7_SEDHY|nr:YidC/Oxa1 family membrane protein insertase [Sedimentibacter hydroxybenzoicus]NYB75452.1 membrane protein insertase YidC [Sedimentibacter hydroxybenzoicus DSM 7310]